MFRFIKKSLLWITSGTVSVMLTACYGVTSMAECFSKKVTVVNEEGVPIPGLTVSVSSSGSEKQLTDSDGVAEVTFCSGNATVSAYIYNDETDDDDTFDDEEFGKIEEQKIVLEANDDPETVVVESAE